MRVNTGRFLEVNDLADLIRAYSNAYLHANGVSIDGVTPAIDRQYNLGSDIIKTADNSMLTFNTTTAINNTEQAIEGQVLSNKLHENFLDTISALIVNDYPRLPCTKLKIAFFINHDDTHWTLMMANFEGLSQRQYRALYRAYQEHKSVNPVSEPTAGSETSLAELQFNDVKNFLIAHKAITFNTRNAEQLVPGNLVLPMAVNSITLTHHDSMGDGYDETVESAAQRFIEQHGATFEVRQCERQNGATCGDWSVYNAMRFGLLNQDANKKAPFSPTKFSRTLRALSENITQNNAAQILYSNKPKIQEAADSERVCVTQQVRDWNRMCQENEHRMEKRKVRDRVLQNLQENREKAQNNSRFNNRYPVLNFFARLVLGSLVTISLFWTLSALLAINAGFALCFAMVSGIASSYYLYDLIGAFIFGEEIVLIGLNEKDKPEFQDLSAQEGLINFLGINAPYHKPLYELESDIAALLAGEESEDPPLSAQQKENQSILTHYYAQKIVQANPHCFYNADRAAVNKPSYANKKRAKSIRLEVETEVATPVTAKSKASAG